MDDILLIIGWFITAFLIHVLLYRIFIRKRIVLISLVILYFGGIPLVIAKHMLFPYRGMHLFITAICLNVIAGVTITIFYLARFLAGQTPSTIIFRSFQDKPIWKKRELYGLFNEKELIDVRIRSLVDQRYISKKNTVYKTTLKGKFTYLLIVFIAKSFGMEVGG